MLQRKFANHAERQHYLLPYERLHIVTLLDERPGLSNPADLAITQKPRTETRREISLAVGETTASQASGTSTLRWTRVAAVAITTCIAAASFVLSFATLWDLATRAGWPRDLSWLWPVIVDGTILQATIGVVALAPHPERRNDRKFFWAVLMVSATVSISCNALHAFIPTSGAFPPALAAAIAAIAPISLLATTHGIAVLSRIRPLAHLPAVPARLEWGSGQVPQEDDDGYDEVGMEELRVDHGPDWEGIASTMRDRELTKRPQAEVVYMLRCKFENKWSNRRIAENADLHHSTVGSVVNAAKAVEPSLAAYA
jgi:hypothetical protein